MTLTIFTDGGSLNNPGEAAIAFVIYQGNKILHQFSKRIGVASNNVAEYTALIEALSYVKTLKSINKISVFADSLLMINQVNGLFKVKHTDMRGLLSKIRFLENELNVPINYNHVLREKNELADSLVKKALGR